jgi:hypothetical protein
VARPNRSPGWSAPSASVSSDQRTSRTSYPAQPPSRSHFRGQEPDRDRPAHLHSPARGTPSAARARRPPLGRQHWRHGIQGTTSTSRASRGPDQRARRGRRRTTAQPPTSSSPLTSHYGPATGWCLDGWTDQPLDGRVNGHLPLADSTCRSNTLTSAAPRAQTDGSGGRARERRARSTTHRRSSAARRPRRSRTPRQIRLGAPRCSSRPRFARARLSSPLGENAPRSASPSQLSTPLPTEQGLTRGRPERPVAETAEQVRCSIRALYLRSTGQTEICTHPECSGLRLIPPRGVAPQRLDSRQAGLERFGQ